MIVSRYSKMDLQVVHSSMRALFDCGAMNL